MVYRPTVRYDEMYRDYVDQVYRATSLDRNQIVRLALFAAPFSPLFNAQLKKHMTSPLPSPQWGVVDHGLWMDQSFTKREGGTDVNGESEKAWQLEQQPAKNEKVKGRQGKVYNKPIRITNQGGITIKIG